MKKQTTSLSCNTTRTTMLSITTTTTKTTNVPPAKISPQRRSNNINNNNKKKKKIIFASWKQLQQPLKSRRLRLCRPRRTATATVSSPYFACSMLHRLKQTYSRRAAATTTTRLPLTTSAAMECSDGLWRDAAMNDDDDDENDDSHDSLRGAFVPPPTMSATHHDVAAAAAAKVANNGIKEERDTTPTMQPSMDEQRDDDASSLLSAWKKKHHIEEEEANDDDDDDDDSNMDLIDLSDDDADSCASSLFHTNLSPIKPPQPRRRHVQFAPWTTVQFIPSHREYSPEEKLLLWTSPASIKLNARRNVKEWRYEGKDYRDVLEEEDFLCDAYGNQWHPVHWIKLSSSLPKQLLQRNTDV